MAFQDSAATASQGIGPFLEGEAGPWSYSLVAKVLVKPKGVSDVVTSWVMQGPEQENVLARTLDLYGKNHLVWVHFSAQDIATRRLLAKRGYLPQDGDAAGAGQLVYRNFKF